MRKNLLRAIKNYFKAKRYPFLVGYYGRTHAEKFQDKYDFLMSDLLPGGWNKAFGRRLWRDLRKAMTKDDLRDLYLTDIKEKYGTLRIYTSYSTDKVDDIISYYEDLSMVRCINCGRPTKYVTHGWILYICDHCKNEAGASAELITTEYIPKRYSYSDGKEKILESKVNFKKYWPEPVNKR